VVGNNLKGRSDRCDDGNITIPNEDLSTNANSPMFMPDILEATYFKNTVLSGLKVLIDNFCR
jgi:hypothetical protein